MAKKQNKASKKNIDTNIEASAIVARATESIIEGDLEQFLNEIADEANTIEAAAEEMPVVEAPVVEAKVTTAAQAAPVIHHEPIVVEGDFGEMLKEITTEARENTSAQIRLAFNHRADFELAKNPEGEKMQANLKGYEKKLSALGACAVLIASRVDTDFINREVSAGNRFNVYAIDKVNDIVSALESGVMRNAVNKAIMQSLFKFRAAGIAFTGVAAIAATSDKVKVEKALTALLVRHTVSAATAPTQSSSTMSALQTLGVVVNRGSKKFPEWQLTDTPQTRRLEAVLGMAA